MALAPRVARANLRLMFPLMWGKVYGAFISFFCETQIVLA